MLLESDPYGRHRLIDPGGGNIRHVMLLTVQLRQSAELSYAVSTHGSHIVKCDVEAVPGIDLGNQ